MDFFQFLKFQISIEFLPRKKYFKIFLSKLLGQSFADLDAYKFPLYLSVFMVLDLLLSSNLMDMLCNYPATGILCYLYNSIHVLTGQLRKSNRQIHCGLYFVRGWSVLGICIGIVDQYQEGKCSDGEFLPGEQ